MSDPVFDERMLTDIAQRCAREVVRELMAISLGVDFNDTTEVRSFQMDLLHLRSQRLASEKIGGVVKAALIISLCTGAISMFYLGVVTALHR